MTELHVASLYHNQALNTYSIIYSTQTHMSFSNMAAKKNMGENQLAATHAVNEAYKKFSFRNFVKES